MHPGTRPRRALRRLRPTAEGATRALPRLVSGLPVRRTNIASSTLGKTFILGRAGDDVSRIEISRDGQQRRIFQGVDAAVYRAQQNRRPTSSASPSPAMSAKLKRRAAAAAHSAASAAGARTDG